MNKIKACWHRESQPNLGDELTPIILQRLFNLEVEFAHAPYAQLISTGSVLEKLKSGQLAARNTPIAVVGSGFIRPGAALPTSRLLHVASVRGYLSKNRLGSAYESRPVGVGDPGLLLPLLVGNTKPPTGKTVGIILHYVMAKNHKLVQTLQEAFGEVKFINIATDDIDVFAHEIKQCELVLSSSLHGLIFSDALGIPNAWLKLGGLVGGDFKFYDYFSSVGRPFYRYITAEDVGTGQIDKGVTETDLKRVSALQQDVLHSFEESFEWLGIGDKVRSDLKTLLSNSEVEYEIELGAQGESYVLTPIEPPHSVELVIALDSGLRITLSGGPASDFDSLQTTLMRTDLPWRWDNFENAFVLVDVPSSLILGGVSNSLMLAASVVNQFSRAYIADRMV